MPSRSSWRTSSTDWTGVRNFQARNFLRAMKTGDGVLYYHSGEEKAVVGTATVRARRFPIRPPEPTSAGIGARSNSGRARHSPGRFRWRKCVPTRCWVVCPCSGNRGFRFRRWAARNMSTLSSLPTDAPEPRSSWWRVGLVTVLFVGVLLPRIDSGTLWQHDELLTANRAQEMLMRGNPWSVTFNFAPDFKKPPVHYWLVAIALRALPARPELAVRLPSLLGGAACMLALAALARQAYPSEGPQTGFYAVLALAGCGWFVHHSRTAFLDTGAAFWLLLVIIGCERARKDPRWWWFVGACSVIGAWQKAPFAFGAWIVILVVRWRGRRRNPGEAASMGAHLAGALAVSAVAATGWSVLQGIQYGFPAVFAATRWQTYALMRAHDAADTGFRPYLYWLWMTRDWALVGLCAPVAVASALWPGEKAEGERRKAEMESAFLAGNRRRHRHSARVPRRNWVGCARCSCWCWPPCRFASSVILSSSRRCWRY